MSDALDVQLRVAIYGEFVRTTRAPSAAHLAEVTHTPLLDIREALERLHAGRVVFLAPESREILLAAPLCSVPTPFLVRAAAQSYFGTCIWDALGILAMLHQDGKVETSESIVHFALPAKQWWADIVFT